MYYYAGVTMPSFKSLDGKSVLDFGCGRGGGLAYLANRYQVTKAIGIDTCQYFINYANEEFLPNNDKINPQKNKDEQLEFALGDAEQLENI